MYTLYLNGHYQSKSGYCNFSTCHKGTITTNYTRRKFWRFSELSLAGLHAEHRPSYTHFLCGVDAPFSGFALGLVAANASQI
jgi:hypothetical protein